MAASENLKEFTAAGAVMLVGSERGGHEGESSEVHRHIYRLQGSTFCLRPLQRGLKNFNGLHRSARRHAVDQRAALQNTS